MKIWAVTIPIAYFAVTGVCAAADFHFTGFGDVRLVSAPVTESYLDGGLGKLRYGADDPRPGVELCDVIGESTATFFDTLTLQADGRISRRYGPAVDLLEAFARYAPKSDSEWTWSVRAGAFFPPLSLENEQTGWSSFWTVTPSAINSWVGSELRTIGAEGTLEWRRNGSAVTLIGALFGDNDPAGILIAYRGWNFDDRVTGLFEKTRLPNSVGSILHQPAPLERHLFQEIDSTPGWYLDLSWEPSDRTGFEIMRYDNDADPSRRAGNQLAWHTTFWDLGFRQQIGQFTILSQAVSGGTLIRPSSTSFTQTDFKSAYALIGWDLDNWWLAARADVFETRTHTASRTPSSLSEDGHAFDATVSWLPKSWLRLSAEYLLVEDTRVQRLIDGDAPHQTESQFQLVARTYL
ncbi:MAG: hypothetical protein ACXWLO_00370 [Rhizomicrobium sp.]